jgi:GrpB-like predicted nucleotidyltransferase (UPF0157 family)/RimJ/RimL family protein N-acetyltransferase
MPNDAFQVEISGYDPQWVTRFREAAAELRSIFGAEVVAVHHIGSTSVPNLSAKNVIDILLEVRDIDVVDAFNDQMRAAGYTARGEYGLARRRYFPRITAAGQHMVHVHTWQQGDPEILRHIAFRDYLIAHADKREAYARLKKELVERFNNDKEAYISGKDQFCQETERLSLAWHEEIRSQRLETERLTLLPLNRAELWHYLNRPRQLEAALHCDLSRAVLADPVPGVIRSKMRNSAYASISQVLWHTYWLIIVRSENYGAGLIGYKGVPGPDGTVEIGYGIDPDFRRRGYMTESAAALVDWALAQPGCQSITACTEKENAASIRVLEKLGFSLVKETDEELCWITAVPAGGHNHSFDGK